MSFSTRLKEKREALGITQVQLAKMLGVSKGAVGNYETGLSSPKAEILYKVFDVLHCDANFLFQDEMAHYKEKSSPAPDESEAEEDKGKIELLEYYDDMNQDGQKELVKHARQLTYAPEYKKCASPSSDAKNLTA